MTQTATKGNTQRLVLHAQSAADLMSGKPISIHETATLTEAATFLIEKEISAAPVIDEAGRPVGVLSCSDIVRHESLAATSKPATNDFYHVADLFCPPAFRSLVKGQRTTPVLVRDIMTPTVLSVAPEATALAVVAELLAMKIHRLFVIDESGVLIGVISTFDILRKLHR